MPCRLQAGGGGGPPATPFRAFRLRFAQIRLIIEDIHVSKKLVRVIVLSLLLLVAAGCSSPEREKQSNAVETVISASVPELPTVCIPKVTQMCIPEVVINPWTDEELDALALTLSGECYDHKTQDKRRVCEVVLNRVSDGRFGDSVIEVLSAENQFEGYWMQSRSVSENDYEVAEQALEDWYAGGCKALSEYLFFCAGDNLENEFRCEY